MRTSLAPLVLLALVFVGCAERQNMRATPDRRGHAAGAEPKNPLYSERVAGPGEAWYTLVTGDTLSGVAKKFNTTLEALIKRNDIQDPKVAKAGYQVIVPAPGAARPARPAALAAPAPAPRPAPAPAPAAPLQK